MIVCMVTASYAIGILFGTFLALLVVDRGAPNLLESAAFKIEQTSRSIVESLRCHAARLRNRQRVIEEEHRARLSRTAVSH